MTEPYTTGQPIPVTIRNVDAGVHRAMRAEALRQNIPFGVLVTRVWWLWLQEQKEEA